MMSDGKRSGVNCTLLKFNPSVFAKALTAVVLASPGTPSKRMCPRQSSPASKPSTILS